MDKRTRAVLNQLAADERGLFSAAQAREIGISYPQLLRAERSWQLRRVRWGVYAMAGVATSPWEDTVAAALAAGPGAAVSHASAAAVHGFDHSDVTTIELTLPRHGYGKPAGVVVHRYSDLTSCDLVSRRGVLVSPRAGLWSTWPAGSGGT